MIKMANFNGAPEIFHSFQGEGKSTGTPSVFIRLSLCNLYCRWCDTDYTWNWENTQFEHIYDNTPNYSKYIKSKEILLVSNNDIVANVSSYNCNNIILTGGEPMVQQKDLISLLELFKDTSNHYTFEVETNGTIIPLDGFERHIDQFNVSIKLSNSGVKYGDRINSKAIQSFASNPNANFKFVLDEQKDLDEVIQLIETYSIPTESIYIMPQGITSDELTEKKEWIERLCKEYGFTSTDRLHIHQYGSKRGV